MRKNSTYPTIYRYLPITGGLAFSLLGFAVGLFGFYCYWNGCDVFLQLWNNRITGLLAAVLAIPVMTSLFAIGGMALSFMVGKVLKSTYERKTSLSY